MNICYISNSASPSKNASSLQIAKLCEYISKKGHTVKLILPNTGLDKNFNNFYNIKSKYGVEKLKYFKRFPIGINYYLYSIFSILKSNYKKQDLFITRNFFTSFILSLLSKKHILEIHDDIKIESRIAQFLVKYFKILNFKSLIKIITTTKTLKKKYQNYGVIKNKIHVLHNASSLKSQFNIYKNKKYLKIGYFGSIFQSRGIKMIQKLSILDKKNKYYIFGGTAKQINKIKRNVQNKNLLFFPYIPYSEVSKEIKKVDVCILPYTSKITVSGNVGDISKFTSPLKIFDYMKLGKLIISSNLPVLREVLIDQKNCLLVNKFADEKAWFDKISSVTKNFRKFDKLRNNAFNYAKKYDLNWRVQKLLSI
ncbi:glycosyltransferase [Candidatus Pelagibacter sp.]|nr:glycosyltransferase [Candidatus Pelagibacter sp.]